MAKHEITTKFFHFRQNNSGGSFHIEDDRGIGVDVWVEALNTADACSRAEAIGIYFDGCSTGMDCACCGDRWSAPWRDDGEETPKIDPWNDTVYVHHLDGKIERIKAGQR